MSMLAFIWVTSLASMLGVAWYGWRQSYNRGDERVEHYRLGDLASKEAHLLVHDVVTLIEGMKPHGARALRGGLVFVRRGQDFFLARVYGKMKTNSIGASSFFLKQIREHKEQDTKRISDSREM